MPYPLSSIVQGAEKIVKVLPATTVNDAVELMIKNDFSQLPVVNDEGNLLGIFSEQDIVRAQFHTPSTNVLYDTVGRCRSHATTLTPEDSLFDALDLLKYKSAIVIVEGKTPIGIMTDWDTTKFFRELSEGIMWARDIETLLRRTIDEVFAETAVTDSLTTDQKHPRLSLGGLIRFITKDENWPKFQSTFGSKERFSELMETARRSRNIMAHERGQATRVELDGLKRALDWLNNCPKLPSVRSAQLEHISNSAIVVAATTREKNTSHRSKYAPLADWLRTHKSEEGRVRLPFVDIEKLLGFSLPPSHTFTNWWANDSSGHVQSKAWLAAGWKVEGVDMDQREVTFRRQSVEGL